jgi:hypothetical protein
MHQSAAGPPRRRLGHRLFLTMGATLLCIVFAGFGPSIVMPAGRAAPLTALVIVHALVFLAWPLLFIAQSTLVTIGRVAVHRRLGIAAAVLALVMLPLGFAATIAMGRRGFDLSGDLKIQSDPLFQMVFQLGDLVTFAVFISAGFVLRRRPEYHKRLMLLGTIGSMSPAPLAHLIGHNYAGSPAVIVPILALLFFTPAIYERVKLGHVHRVTLIGAIALLSWAVVRGGVIGPSKAWHDIAAWLVR